MTEESRTANNIEEPREYLVPAAAGWYVASLLRNQDGEPNSIRWRPVVAWVCHVTGSYADDDLGTGQPFPVTVDCFKHSPDSIFMDPEGSMFDAEDDYLHAEDVVRALQDRER